MIEFVNDRRERDNRHKKRGFYFEAKPMKCDGEDNQRRDALRKLHQRRKRVVPKGTAIVQIWFFSCFSFYAHGFGGAELSNHVGWLGVFAGIVVSGGEHIRKACAARRRFETSDATFLLY
jgi:hypothetical protein